MSGEAPTRTRRVVYKAVARVEDFVVLELPKGAEIVHIGDQHGTGAALTFWFICDPAVAAEVGPVEEHRFIVLGTGHGYDPENVGAHRATVVTAGGALVWHVFEEFVGCETAGVQEEAQPEYPAELLDELASALALALVDLGKVNQVKPGQTFTHDRDALILVLDRYGQEVGRENVPQDVAVVMGGGPA